MPNNQLQVLQRANFAKKIILCFFLFLFGFLIFVINSESIFIQIGKNTYHCNDSTVHLSFVLFRYSVINMRNISLFLFCNLCTVFNSSIFCCSSSIPFHSAAQLFLSLLLRIDECRDLVQTCIISFFFHLRSTKHEPNS